MKAQDHSGAGARTTFTSNGACRVDPSAGQSDSEVSQDVPPEPYLSSEDVRESASEDFSDLDSLLQLTQEAKPSDSTPIGAGSALGHLPPLLTTSSTAVSESTESISLFQSSTEEELLKLIPANAGGLFRKLKPPTLVQGTRGDLKWNKPVSRRPDSATVLSSASTTPNTPLTKTSWSSHMNEVETVELREMSSSEDEGPIHPEETPSVGKGTRPALRIKPPNPTAPETGMAKAFPKSPFPHIPVMYRRTETPETSSTCSGTHSIFTPMSAATSITDIKPFNGIHSAPNVAVSSAILGIACGLAGAFLWNTHGTEWAPLWSHILALTAFHFLEYLANAMYCPSQTSMSSFLIPHSTSYALAHLTSIAEFIVTTTYLPNLKSYLFPSIVIPLGVFLVVSGQVLRFIAIRTLGESFHHIVQEVKRPQHRLVLDGVYRFLRHPSYTGFYYWAIGTQLALQNVLCLPLFLWHLYDFFAERIDDEEEALIRWYGDEYRKYREKTGTGIPFL